MWDTELRVLFLLHLITTQNVFYGTEYALRLFRVPSFSVAPSSSDSFESIPSSKDGRNVINDLFRDHGQTPSM